MDILEILNRYDVEVVKQGTIHVGYCPFHVDVNRPNFTVYTHTNSWFCYTCSKGGDAIFFVSLIEKVSRKQAELIVYNNLQYLVSKLNKEDVEPPCNEGLNLEISKLFRHYLQSHPNDFNKVKPLMSEVDNRLLKDLTLDEGLKLFGHINTQLQKI